MADRAMTVALLLGAALMLETSATFARGSFPACAVGRARCCSLVGVVASILAVGISSGLRISVGGGSRPEALSPPALMCRVASAEDAGGWLRTISFEPSCKQYVSESSV